MGFTHAVLPKENLKRLPPMDGITLHGVDTVMQALAILF